MNVARMMTATNARASKGFVVDSKLQTALVSAITMAMTGAASYWGLVSPTQKMSDNNRDANFSCRDHVADLRQDADDWKNMYQEHMRERHGRNN